ncbi:hypothetical protein FRC01_000085 [Tulasnella sp. 417]|nr:hypothetical protein FRC01_000085 [Tulasnella sp. 417]
MAMKSSQEPEPHYQTLESVREINPLRIPEILLRVLELASPGAKATAACVCRSWSSPALDMLWQNLTDVAPFLKIFALLKQIDSSRISSAEALERIKFYGARVQTLRFDASNSSILHERGAAEVYQALCEHTLEQYLPTVPIPSSGLFPNLHTLIWKSRPQQGYKEETLDAVSYFLSPSLKHLYASDFLEPRSELPSRRDLLLALMGARSAPFFRTLNAIDGLRLQSLELRIRKSGELTEDHEVGPFLRQHQDSLQHFHAWDTNLVNLFQNEILGLSRLRSLELVTSNEPQALGFINGLADRTPEMEALRLTIGGSWVAQRWSRLWNALKRLRKLTKLHLTFPEIEELDAGDAKSMREAWPGLSSLYILQQYDGAGGGPRGYSLDFLSAISFHFSTSLTELGLCLGPNLRAVQPISPVRFEKLRLFHVQSYYEPGDQEGLVRYLARILPHEAEFKGDFSDEWDPVVDGLRQTRVLRGKDRDWKDPNGVA